MPPTLPRALRELLNAVADRGRSGALLGPLPYGRIGVLASTDARGIAGVVHAVNARTVREALRAGLIDVVPGHTHTRLPGYFDGTRTHKPGRFGQRVRLTAAGETARR